MLGEKSQTLNRYHPGSPKSFRWLVTPTTSIQKEVFICHEWTCSQKLYRWINSARICLLRTRKRHDTLSKAIFLLLVATKIAFNLTVGKPLQKPI
jgi:hypothetical protein